MRQLQYRVTLKYLQRMIASAISLWWKANDTEGRALDFLQECSGM